MKNYLISYITTSGTVVLNNLIEADSYANSIDQIKDDTTLILSLVSVLEEKKPQV